MSNRSDMIGRTFPSTSFESLIHSRELILLLKSELVLDTFLLLKLSRPLWYQYKCHIYSRESKCMSQTVFECEPVTQFTDYDSGSSQMFSLFIFGVCSSHGLCLRNRCSCVNMLIEVDRTKDLLFILFRYYK